jgi:L-ascorbate metabolism protein UlaG (beta-lactamase superfamily)
MARHGLLVGIAALASGVMVGATSAQAQGKVSIQWVGHATFLVTSPGGTQILLDPWLSKNPAAPDSLKAVAHYKPAAILVTHAHFDHAGDAKAVATASGAPVISVGEWIETLGLPEKQSLGGNVGGTFKIGDVTIHIVPAMHSSEPGRPVGFVLQFTNGQTIYDTGDTWIFGDMALIQELYHPTILLLNTGGGPYGEDPATAKLAVAKYFHPTTIIPMHYATFPALATAADVKAAFAGDARLVMLHPGETRAF